jgi:hypothetical protein
MASTNYFLIFTGHFYILSFIRYNLLIFVFAAAFHRGFNYCNDLLLYSFLYTDCCYLAAIYQISWPQHICNILYVSLIIFMISCHKESVPSSPHFKIVWCTAKYMPFCIFRSSYASYSRSENTFSLKFHVVLVILLMNWAKWRASNHKQELLTLHEHLIFMGYVLCIVLVFVSNTITA